MTSTTTATSAEVGSSPRGVVLSLTASVLFGLTFLVAGLVEVTADALFGWRMVVTAVTTVALTASPPGRRAFAELGERVRGRPFAVVGVVGTSALVGFQMWLFAWAPMNDRALDASMGYLLLPLVLVVAGRAGFGDRVSPMQWTAIAIATVAVAVALVAAATLSWVVPAICLGYALYFVVRRRAGLNLTATFGAEILLLLPVGLLLVAITDDGVAAGADPVVLLTGLAGAVAMGTYLAASRRLSMPVFGLLTYAEPVLLFVGALLLGETLSAVDVVTYALLAVALLVLGLDGVVGRERTR